MSEAAIDRGAAGVRWRCAARYAVGILAV